MLFREITFKSLGVVVRQASRKKSMQWMYPYKGTDVKKQNGGEKSTEEYGI